MIAMEACQIRYVQIENLKRIFVDVRERNIHFNGIPGIFSER